MKFEWMKPAMTLTILAVPFAAGAQENGALSGFQRGYEGAYVAALDLNPVGFARIEAMSLILHPNGTAVFMSESEVDDQSSSGFGVWEEVAQDEIRVGLLMYRMTGPAATTTCAAIGVYAPDNCVLKLGATLTPYEPGKLTGSMRLTIEGPGGDAKPDKTIFEIPFDLPFTMRLIELGEFPEAQLPDSLAPVF